MKRLKLLPGACLCLLLLFTACQKQTALKEEAQATKRSAAKSSDSRTFLNQINPGQRNLKLIPTQPFPDQHSGYRNLVLNKLNDVATCDDNTPINAWLDSELADWTSTTIGYVLDWGMLNYPMYNAFIFENDPTGQVFGVNGEYTQRLTKTFKDLKRFWDIESANMVMVPMHGSMLLDREKVLRTVQAIYYISEEDANYVADVVVFLANEIPQYRKGNHPIFSFNAFAVKADGIPDKIVMGDGMLDGYNAIGYGDVAPQAILAHEFGHQVQYYLNLPDEQGPVASRKKELMADAFSAYFLTHARGASMNWKRVQQFLQVFFNIGDCATTSDDHHGTPTQRMAAASWAYQLAASAQKKGLVLSPAAFVAMFEAALPQILSN
ncbi:hypothetical protein [Niabella hirudinis]|uniref:hypothetical protein n=1 Tax=Niabella hirudinis TaxID=1285929 RepID=UPI003EBC29D4